MCGVATEVEKLSEGDVEGEEEVAKVKEGTWDEVGRVKVVKDERRMRALVGARQPIQKEVVEHECSHLPYRSWCKICVKAKGKDMGHQRDAGEA